MRARRRSGSTLRLLASMTVVAGSVLGGGVVAGWPSALVGSGPAGADTPGFTLTCTGVPGVGTVGFPTVITGSIPAQIPDGTNVSLTGSQWLVTVPASVTNVIDSTYGVGATVTASVTATIDATGATPASQSETVDFGSAVTPAAGNSFLLTGTAASAPTFTGTGSNVSVTPGTTISAFGLVVNSNSQPPFSCTTPTPPPVIAQSGTDSTAYVTNPGPNTISPIDSVSGTAGAPFAFDTSEPGSIAITPNGSTAYVTGVNSNEVTPVDLANDAVGSPITVGNQADAIAITPNGGAAYVANYGDNTVTPIDLATASPESAIAVGGEPDAIAITPNGSTAYVANYGADTLTLINLATGSPERTIAVGSEPDAIAVTPNGTTAYVANYGDDTVTPIDLATGAPESAIAVGSEPEAIAVTPNGTTAYVANYGGNTVTPIDLATGSPGSAIAVGSEPKAIAVTPNGSTAEVVNFGDGTVTPIDAVSDTPGAAISAGGDPLGVALTPDQAPVAALSVTPADAGQATTLDASASVAPSSPITNYAWNFGAGTTGDTSTPTTTHTYADQGAYTASVTETDAQGTSLTKVFTGQTVSQNGGPQAETSSTFNVGVVATDSCTVPGFGSASFPTVVSESTAPPSSIDAGGTFQTAFGAEVTIPASVINHFRTLGATSLTVGAQTTAEDGRTSAGAPSGAVSPNTESASATNLPQSDSTLVPGASYSFTTSYNPVTWQTGPGAGVVDFTPGAISVATTFVIHGTPTDESINCTPPAGVATIGSTTVNPPPATPTFQVPTSTPPLQNQVTPGTDGGWGITIANTSTATVTGLTARVSATDSGAALSFDLGGMAATGTNCSSAGSGTISCSIGSLAAGTSKILDVLVRTSGLVHGVAITGAAVVTSSNQTGDTSLGSIGVTVVQNGNGTKSVAVPGVALVSTKSKLFKSKTSITLTLPKKRITKLAPNGEDLMAGEISRGSDVVTLPPPPVAVVLRSLAPSSEPALCPPTGKLKCQGNVIQAVGNFSAYTNNQAPIVAVLKFFYGKSVPTGSVYMLAPNGRTVNKLTTCKKTSTGYSTPCLDGPEQHLGSAASDSRYAQDTLYFTGADPVMGRR
jgi:YVTN family beta-propeller protein